MIPILSEETISNQVNIGKIFEIIYKNIKIRQIYY